MKRPYDFIENEKIDLSIAKHRDVVIKRNNALSKAFESGIPLNKTVVIIAINTFLECFACGTQITNTRKTTLYDGINVLEEMPNVDCPCCGHKYTFNGQDEKYQIKKPTEKKPTKISKK